jgi:hypothetical protein
MADWLRAQADAAISEYLLVPELRCDALSAEAVRRLARAHVEGTDRRSGRLLLSILMLEIWLATYLPRAVPRASRVPDPVAIGS